MTQETEQQILTTLKELREETTTLRTHLVGDRLKNIVGIVDILETHRRELYGDDKTRDVGMKSQLHHQHDRLKSLENDRVKILSWSAGVSAAMMAIWTLIKDIWHK